MVFIINQTNFCIKINNVSKYLHSTFVPSFYSIVGLYVYLFMGKRNLFQTLIEKKYNLIVFVLDGVKTNI